MAVESGRLYLHEMIHPLEEEAMLSIQNDGLVDYIAKLCGSVQMQTVNTAKMVLTGYPITADTSPRVFVAYRRVLHRLHCDEEYPLFVDFGYELTAKTYGSGKDGHLIVLNSACVEELDDGELQALMGHEIGHILAEHIQYRQLLDTMDVLIQGIPLAKDIVKKKIWSFFSKWMIASEYTADRAALIASGSLKSVFSLLRHQAGASKYGIGNSTLLQEEPSPIPENLGIFFMLMSESFPTFGMVDRMRQIAVWAISDEFRQSFPYIYYLSRLVLEEEGHDEEDDELLLLHKRANAGNAIAQYELGRCYLLNEQGLPLSPEVGISLLRSAAFLGDGKAMYLLSRAMKVGTAGLRPDRSVQAQLLKASASRFPAAGKVADGLPDLPRLVALPKIVEKFCKKRFDTLKCQLNREFPGEPLPESSASMVQDAFWISRADPIYAAGVKRTGFEVFGTAIAAGGVYGRLPGQEYPFCIPWKEFLEGSLYHTYHYGKACLGLGDRVICAVSHTTARNKLEPGSMGELLAAIRFGAEK